MNLIIPYLLEYLNNIQTFISQKDGKHQPL